MSKVTVPRDIRWPKQPRDGAPAFRIAPRQRTAVALMAWILASTHGISGHAEQAAPPGLRGTDVATIRSARYEIENTNALAGTVVRHFQLESAPAHPSHDPAARWFSLHATQANASSFRVWCLVRGDQPRTRGEAHQRIARYILQMGTGKPTEFRHPVTGGAVLPSAVGWPDLWPKNTDTKTTGNDADEWFPNHVDYLGHLYQRKSAVTIPGGLEPVEPRIVPLRPDLWLGVPSNQRTRDGIRRYDGSEYEMVRLTRDDYAEMAAAGMTCVRVDAEQRPWIEDLPLFYWGVGGADVPFPASMYDSRYLGPALFLDEPAVHTRDSVIRPQLAKDPAYRKSIRPRLAFEAFQETFRHAWQEGAANTLMKGFAARSDVDLGTMTFRQSNLYSWETMISTAAYQLSQDPDVPSAIVFEPPGRLGTWRTLPEMNMSYGCQIPVDDPKAFTSILYGFLRGAARLTDKAWGVSIYGAVDRADAPWFLTHAYDLGATRFFFWDNYQLACVPYRECLDLARHLRRHVENRPDRDLERLRAAAEVAILLPPGYNLGHVHMGKGNLWGVTELNLERLNDQGVTYRVVMSQFFLEIERCLRLGISFDLLWDLPGFLPQDYREVVRIRENGTVEIASAGETRPQILPHARTPERPAGSPPHLSVHLSSTEGAAPLSITARAIVEETSAPVFYTHGADPAGVHHNAAVAWELYGPEEEDQRALPPPRMRPNVTRTGTRREITTNFTLDQPGAYRLRVSSVDVAGRSAVEWIPIAVRVP